MIELKKMTRVLLIAAMATAMGACSDDNPVDDGSGDGGFNDDGRSELTHEQQKQRLESVAIEASQLFNPEDQQVLIDLANYWGRMYGHLDVPTEWDEAANTPAYTPAHTLGLIGKALEHGDLSALAYGRYTYYYEFSKFTGVYEPGRYTWNKVADSNDIVFRFANAQGGQTVVTAKASGSNGSFTYEDYDKYTVVAPKTMQITIVDGGATLVSIDMNVDFDENAHHVAYTIGATIGNIGVNSTMNATDTRIDANGTVTVSGRMLVNYSANVSGQGMATRSEIEHLIDYGNENDFCRMFKSADAEANILGQLQVKAKMTDLRTIIDVMDSYYDDYEFDSKEQARQACQEGCNRLAGALKGRLYFDGSNDMEAEITYAPNLDESEGYYYSWWEWYVDPQIKFSDGTTYSLSGYFDGGRFASVENAWTNLWNSYKQLWR